MGPASVQCFTLFFFILSLTSASGSGKPVMDTTVRDTGPDTYPTINPSGGTPGVNPTPPITTVPTLTPTTTPATTPATTTTAPTTTPATPSPPLSSSSPSSGSWCVASASASPTALQVALDYACGYGGADCSAVQPGATCYNPNTLKDHASYAFNDYYQKNPASTSCDFGGTAQLTNTDPSSGSCHYASTRPASSTTPPVTPTMTPTTPTVTPTPPMIQSPPSPTLMTTPIYGAPISSPNVAASMDQGSLLLLGTTMVLMYAAPGNHP